MSSDRPYDAVVIGAGTNGLVAAAALGRAGRRVLLVERNAEIGGKAAPMEFAPGFTSPAVVECGWMPPRVARGLGLTLPAAVTPEVSVSVTLRDGGFLSLPTDAFAATDAIRPHSARDADRWSLFAHQLHRLASFLGTLYERPAPDLDAKSVRELLPLLSLGRTVRALGRGDMTDLLRILPLPVRDLLDDTFESEALKAAVGAGGIRDVRQGPRSSGTAFVLLHYLVGGPVGGVRSRGWWRDGPTACVAAVAEVARRNTVTIRTGATVQRILVEDDVVRGVALAGGETVVAPVVVSTVDPARTLLRLVDPVWLDPEFLHAVHNIKFRGCTTIVQFALAELPHVPGLVNPAKALASVVSLTPALDVLERAADAAKYGRFAVQPHIEITVPTLRWPALAPAGRHVLVARVQYTPYDLRGGATWDDDRAEALAESVTRAIGRTIPRFADLVLHRAILTPDDLETQFGLTEGAVTQGELMLDQVLFMRPVPGWARYATPVDGLYLGGSGTHPGPAIAGGSGWLAAQRALGDRRMAGKRSAKGSRGRSSGR